MSYIIEAAISSTIFDMVHVSTDEQSIADLAVDFGASVDFLRPSFLADDHTPMMPVLKFVLHEYARRGAEFDTVASLMACAPFVSPQDLIGAVELFDAHDGAQSVLGVTEYPCPIEWAFRRSDEGMLTPMNPGSFSARSQDLNPAFYDAGQFCIMCSGHILEAEGAGSDSDFLGYPIARTKAIDIDTMEDWDHAERLFQIAEQTRN